MAASTRLAEVFSGVRRARAFTTFLVATLVTSAVAIPLAFRAADPVEPDSPADAVADAAQVIVDTALDEPAPLDQAVVDGSLLISFRHPDAQGVAFNLFPAGQTTPVIQSTDLIGPQFDLVLDDRGVASPLDTREIADGPYELFLTVSTPAGEQRTAVTFTVDNQ